MKKGIFTIAMTLICGYSVAQTTAASNKVKIGLRAGVNLAKIALTGTEFQDNEKDDVKNITSFQFGAYADIPLSTSFSVQPSLILNGKGGEMQLSEAGTQLGPPTITGSVKSNIMYIEVPLNVLYKINGFYIGAGPYAAIALSGKYRSELTPTSSGQTESEDRDMNFGSNNKDDFKRSDFGINLLAGYELKSGIQVGINYGFGLSNIDPVKGTYSNKNRMASFILGFSF
jgi:hypothetical protein